MATFKAIVEPHYKRKDGTYNIRIRVIHNRKKRYISTTYYATPDDLTRGKLRIKNPEFIKSTDDLIGEYRDICTHLGTKLSLMEIDELLSILKNGHLPDKVFRLDFIEYGHGIARQLKESGFNGNARTYEIALNALLRYIGRDKLDISEITSKFIKDFIEWIRQQPAPGNRTKGKRAESLYPSTIRAIHNRAKREFNQEDVGIINIPQSPFSNVTLPPIPITRKRALSVEKIRQIASLPDKHNHQLGTNRYNFARDLFMLSFYLIGMNPADLYHVDEYKDGRISYRRQKTKHRRQDEAFFSVKVEPEAVPLIEKYQDTTGQRVFNFYQLYASANTFNYAVNKGLKIIGAELGIEDLEHGAARHSVATIARNKCGISKDDVDMMLNHVVEKNKVADIYIDQDWSIIDKAQRKVLNYFSGPKKSKKRE